MIEKNKPGSSYIKDHYMVNYVEMVKD